MESRAMEERHSALILRCDEDSIVDTSQRGLTEKSNVTASFVLGIFAISCSTFSFGCVIGYSAPTHSAIMEDLKLSSDEFSFFGSILTIGGIVGATICGKVSDFFGRIGTMWITNLLLATGWLAIAFAQHVWVLDLGRLLHGVTIGVFSYLGPIYVSEVTPSNLRGTISSLIQMMIGVGISALFLIGIVANWRTLALIGSTPCVMTFPLLFLIPESPRWLAKIGKLKELKEALQALRGPDVDVSDEAAEILEYTGSTKFAAEGRFLDLFQPRYSYSVIIGVVLLSLPQLEGVNGYIFYTDAIFRSAGSSTNVGFIISSAVQILASVVGTALVETQGRRPLFLVSQAIMFLGCLMTTTAYFLQIRVGGTFEQESQCLEKVTPILALVSVLVYLGGYGLGVAQLPWIIASELYPINIKGTAGAACNLASMISSWLVTYFFNSLLEWNSGGTFLIFAIVSGIGLVFIAKLVPETKGRTLEEIQASISPY